MATDGSAGWGSTPKPAAAVSSRSEDKFLHLETPIETWTREARELVNRLGREELTTSEGWTKAGVASCADDTESPDDTRNMIRADREQTGKYFKVVHWYNHQEVRVKGVVEFGRYLQGPPKCTHGGASATIADSVMGMVITHSDYKAVTLNLDVTYKNFVLLDKPYIAEAWIEKIEGRKLYAKFQMVCAETRKTCVTATSLFLALTGSPRKAALGGGKTGSTDRRVRTGAEHRFTSKL